MTVGDEAKMIDPSGIPHFIGDLGTLDTDVMLLTANAGQFRASGSNLHTTFQQLSAFYSAPEADQLFSTTLPVQQKSDAFADGLEKVAGALSDYSLEIAPLVQKLESLRAEATAFVNSVSADDDWRKDQDKIDRNDGLWRDVNHTIAAFQAAERRAYDKIMALIGGTPLITDDGSHAKNMYGYTAADLDQAQETPWGAPAEREYEGWEWLVHQGKQVWDGIWYDGVVATVHGLGTLVGWDGWDAAGEAWTNLAKLGTAGALTSATMGAWWLVPDKDLPSWLRDSRTVYKQTVKGFLAWDQWKTNPARAAGGFGFNVLTILGTEGAGAAASGTGKAGAAARVASAAGKVGRVIDPMTYVGKAGKFAFVKVGDTFSTLKNLHSGAYLDMANLGERYAPAEHPLPLGERPVSVPDSAIEYVDAKGNPVYLTKDGHVLNADGSTRQHVTQAKTELSAGDRTTLDSTPHTPTTGARVPEVVAVHGGDNLPDAAAHPPAGAAPHLPNGGTDGLTHGPSASHEPPGTHGRSTSQAGSEHAPYGSLGHDTTPAGDHNTTGHGVPGAGGEGGRIPPSGGHDLPGSAAPEPPRGNLPDGSWEGENGLHLPRDANAAADHFIRQSTEAEPRVTEALQAAVGRVEHGRLNGLEYRLKGEDSLKRKVATALLEDPELTPERALASIRDSLRYTVEIPTRDYSHGVQQAVDELRARGFENVTFKNTWDGSGYKGINSTWRDPSTGQTFEVQFHTPESFAAKMDTHILYEKGRLPGISREEFDAIQAAQNELFDRVPVPHGTDSIRLDHDLHSAGPAHTPDVHLGRHGDESVHGNGPPPELTPEQRAAHDAHLHDLAQQHRDDFDQLKQDPDHKGKVKPAEMDEARVALDLRENGKVPADIQRPPAANQGDLYSPSNGEFYDIKGVHSDWPPLNNVRDKSLPFKGAYDPANNQKWVSKLEDQIVVKGRIVILDMRNANQAAIDDVKSIVEQHGWSDRVVWYP